MAKPQSDELIRMPPLDELKRLMQTAIEEARVGLAEGGIPIGSALALDGEVVARGHNRRVQRSSTVLHAEMDCLEATGRRISANDFQRLRLVYDAFSLRYVQRGDLALQDSGRCDRREPNVPRPRGISAIAGREAHCARRRGLPRIDAGLHRRKAGTLERRHRRLIAQVASGSCAEYDRVLRSVEGTAIRAMIVLRSYQSLILGLLIVPGAAVSFGQAAAAQSFLWQGYAENPQHTTLSPVASQPLAAIRWTANEDLDPQYSGGDLLIHYGSPMLTAGNLAVVPVKTTASGGFEVQGLIGSTGGGRLDAQQRLRRAAHRLVVPAVFADAHNHRTHLLRRRWRIGLSVERRVGRFGRSDAAQFLWQLDHGDSR